MINRKSAIPSDSYMLSVADMSCEHCVQAVESAALSVDGVTEARVDLDRGLVQVSGGKPHAVIEAIVQAGYEARPKAQIPESCEIPVPEAGTGQGTQLPAEEPEYLIRVTDMSCSACVANVEKAIRSVEGVVDAAVNLVEKEALVRGGDPERVVAAIVDKGYEASLPEESRKATVSGYEVLIDDMSCSACVANVEKAIRSVAGVRTAVVNLIEKKALVEGGDAQTVVNAIIDQGYAARLPEQKILGTFYLTPAEGGPEELPTVIKILTEKIPEAEVESTGSRVQVTTDLHPAEVVLLLKDENVPVHVEEHLQDPWAEQEAATRLEIRRSWQRAALAASVGFGVMAGQMSGLFPPLDGHRLFWLAAALVCLGTMYFSGKSYYVTAWKQARHGTSNMDTLVALGTAAAWLSSLMVIIWPNFIPGRDSHIYLDASVMILAFLQFGHALETRAKRTTSEAIGSLVGLRAKSGRVVVGDREVEIPVSLLRLGDVLRVRPGERVPIDGTLADGGSTVDESMLTGEPLPIKKEPGDLLTGGTMNKSGTFTLTVTRLGEDTTLSHIIGMVKKAQLSKPPIGRLADKVSSIFVPVVICISILTFIVWFVVAPEPKLAFALTAAIAVLVIACPCSLGLATPIAIMVGTSRAAQLNVLIKNSDGLQTASTLSHVVVDKTGTLTEGAPSVTEILPHQGQDRGRILQLAASLESGSEHPLAEAVLDALEKEGGTLLSAEQFKAVSGRGVEGEIEGRTYLLGNHLFLQDRNVALPNELMEQARVQAASGATPIWLADEKEKKVQGLLVLRDPIRPDSQTAVKALQKQGVVVVMCTGDNRATAESVAAELGIDEVHSEVLPEEKLEVIRKLQEQGYKVGMVGDGVNDAPALAQADTGFAIGSGTDVAIENADITLAGDSLAHVSVAIEISSATIRNIKQNLFGAFVYNTIGIPLAAGVFYPFTGWLLQPMFASAAMALSSVTVVSNANRLRFFKPRVRKEG